MRNRIKISSLILTVFLAAALLTACGAKTIEIPMFDGTIIEVETKGLSKEQVDMLEQVSSGEENIMSLMQSGLFTSEEMTEIGFANVGMNPGNRGGMAQSDMASLDLSDVDINDLNLEGLTDEQLRAIEGIISGETSIQQVVENNIMTQQQIMATGLMGGQRPSGGMGFSNSSGRSRDNGDNSD